MPLSSNEEQNKSPMNPVEAEFNNRIEFLSNVVYKLEDTKRQLDSIVSTHAAHQINFKEAETKLYEILNDIESRKNIILQISQEINKLSAQKVTLQNECTSLDVIVSQKKEYVNDIENLSNGVKLLQKEMEEFSDQHSTNKRNADDELKSIKNMIKDLHHNIGLIANKN